MNESLKQAMKKQRLYRHEVAAYLGISESSFYRLLRSNLTVSQKEKIENAITDLSKRQYQLKHA
ncbi:MULTISPECIES: hypothetical protein [Bacillus]|uniref:hypothetical protein n=1 Tax=Bacillus TaxID=1386 RepID=UPI0003001CD8|nr:MULTISPECIES: hypothetical protein [Bacillus]